MCVRATASVKHSRPRPPSFLLKWIRSVGVAVGRQPASRTVALFRRSHSSNTTLGIPATWSGNLRAELITAFIQYTACSLVGELLLIQSFASLNLDSSIRRWLNQSPGPSNHTPRYLMLVPSRTSIRIISVTIAFHAETADSVSSIISI
jgi:hypothetical protein